MYTSGSSALSAKIQEYSRTFTARLRMGDGTIVPVANLSYTHGICGEDNVSVGGGMSAMIEAFITDGASLSLKGKIVAMEIGTTLDDGTIEYTPMGTFKIVTTNGDDMGGVNITAYDRMYYEYGRVFTPSVNIGTEVTDTTTDDEGNTVNKTYKIAKILEIIKDIEKQLGVPIVYPVSHELLQSRVKVLNGYTYRETLSYLAGAMAGVCYVDRLGNTIIESLIGGDPITVNGNRYFSLSRAEDDTTVGAVKGDNGEIQFTEGVGTAINVSNPLLTAESFASMANMIIGTTYRPLEVTILGDPRIDINDVLSTTNTNGVTFLSPVMMLEHTFDGGLTTIIKAGEISADVEAGFNGSVSQQLSRVHEELLTTNEILATKATFEEINAKFATIENLNAVNGKFETLDTKYATIENLNAVNGKFETLDAKYASIKDLEVVNLKVGTLQSEIADVNTLIFGNAVGGTISVDFATAIAGSFKNGVIKSAMIDSLAVDKVQGGTISTKKFRVASDDGNLAIADNTMQIKDGTRVRIQIGKDSTGDYNLSLWDATGKKLWDAKGITSDAIRDGLIDNDMINDNANISGDKINLPSLVKEINGSKETIKASHILYDETKQTLDVAFQSMTTDMSKLNGNVSTLQTNLSVANGQISSVITATETLETELGTAIEDIETAIAKADTAQSTANTAKSTADSAKTTATTANNTANTAKATADTATNTANTAKSTADSAKSTATTAQNTADSAKSTATTAQNTANTAKNTADTAKATADTAKSTATTAVTKVTAVETNLNGFKTQVSETYTTKADFNNLKVGGRNILLKSNVEVSNNNFLVKNYKVSELMVVGEVYTLTVCVTPAPKMTHFTPHTSTGYSGVTTLHVSGTTKQVVSSTFKFNGYADGRVPTNPNDRHADIEFYRYPNNNTITGNTTIHWVKLEKGNKATDWTPAPEDVDGKFANYTTTADLNSKLTQTKNEISTEVSGKYTTKADFNDLQIGGRNLLALSKIRTFKNTKLENGIIKQVSADTATFRQLKIQAYQDGTYKTGIYNQGYSAVIGIHYAEIEITKSMLPFNGLYVGLNGSTVDTGVVFDLVEPLEVGKYILQLNFLNLTQGSISWKNMKLEKGNKATDYQQAMEDVQANIDNLQIGGRNLIEKSFNLAKWGATMNSDTNNITTSHGADYTRITFNTTGNGNAYTYFNTTQAREKGQTYTVSFDVKLSNIGTGCVFYWYENERGTQLQFRMDKVNTWERKTFTYTKTSETSSGTFLMGFKLDNPPAGTTLDVRNIKFEKGNRATDWTPAPEDVDGAIATVDKKFANYTTTTDLNTKLTQTKDQIKLEASETYTTKADFNSLKVGGRNILLKSNVEVANNEYRVQSYKVSELMVVGETYTITVCVTPAKNMTHFTPHVSGGNSYVTTIPVTGTAKQVVSTTFTFQGYKPNLIPPDINSSNANVNFYRYPNNGTITSNTTIHWVKLEKGNKATDWTPAPEDVNSEITKAKSEIQVNKDAINLKVSKGDIISSINQTAESVKINASKIDLQGYVTVSALSGSGTTTINGANIKTGAIQSSNYVANSAGTKINLSDGTIDTKGFKVNSAGVATLTGATLTNVDLKFTSDGESVGRIYSYAGGGGFPTLSISGQYGLDLSSTRGVKISGGNVSITADTNISSLTVNNELNTNKIRIVSGSDASETSTGHGLQIGADNTSNIRIDPNEIVVCNNGALSEFYLNAKSIGLHANVNCKGILQSTGGDVRVKNGDNTARLGKGDTDAFVHNSVSGKYLQLKDSGALQYSGTDVILASHFTGTKNTNGYIKLPNGLILQWGSLYMTCTTGGNTVSSTVTFPVKFSSACYQIVTAIAGGAPHICSTSASDYSTSNFKYHLNRTNTTQTSCRWIAIGS